MKIYVSRAKWKIFALIILLNDELSGIKYTQVKSYY